MPRRSKFSQETKVDAVLRYKSGEVSTGILSRELGVDFQTIRNWIRLYETFGPAGLAPAKPSVYSEGFKQMVVAEYNEGLLSQDEMCKKFRIRSQRTLQCWIEEYNRDQDLKEKDNSKPSGKDANPLRQEVSRGRIAMSARMPVTQIEKLNAAVYCIEHNHDYKGTAEKFEVSYSQVYSWVKKYQEEGPESLIDRRGRPKDPAKVDEVDALKAEIRLLKAENKRKDIEIAALKKAWR